MKEQRMKMKEQIMKEQNDYEMILGENEITHNGNEIAQK